jgi:hypothetical protein
MGKLVIEKSKVSYKLFSYYPNIIHLVVYYFLVAFNRQQAKTHVEVQKKNPSILILDTLSGDKNNNTAAKSHAFNLISNIRREYGKNNCNEFILNYSTQSYVELERLIAKYSFNELHFLSPNICLNLRNLGFIRSYFLAKKLRQTSIKVVIYIWDAYDIGSLIFLELFAKLNLEIVSLGSDLTNIGKYGKYKNKKSFKPYLYFNPPNAHSIVSRLEER